MAINWIIERDVFNQNQYMTMCRRVLERGDNLYKVRVIPFVHEIDGPTPAVQAGVPTVCYGSIGVQKLAEKHNWVPGVFTGDFRTSTYARMLEDYFLNYKASEPIKLAHLQTLVNLDIVREPFFCKPDDDNKAFAGQVFKNGEFSDWVNKMQDIGYLESLDFDVVYSPVEELAVEYRCLMVGDDVADMSIYRQWQTVLPERVWDRDVFDFVTKCNNIWRPADVYIIDVAQTREGLKVVEYDTFNSAGFYAMDAANVVDRVSNYVSRK